MGVFISGLYPNRLDAHNVALIYEWRAFRAAAAMKIGFELVKDDHLQQGALKVKTMVSRVLVSAVLLVTASVLGPVSAQTSPDSIPSRVGVIDISFIFKNHPGFKQAMENMKLEVTAFEDQLRARGEQIQKVQEQMVGFKSTSPEYKQLEAQSLKLQADGQAAAALKKKDFLEKEAQIYYQTYNEIVAEVAAFSEKNSFGLVVRFDSEPIDPEDRKSILDGVNRAVVYQNKLNITFAVLEQLKRKTVATAQPGSVRQ